MRGAPLEGVSLGGVPGGCPQGRGHAEGHSPLANTRCQTAGQHPREPSMGRAGGDREEEQVTPRLAPQKGIPQFPGVLPGWDPPAPRRTPAPSCCQLPCDPLDPLGPPWTRPDPLGPPKPPWNPSHPSGSLRPFRPLRVLWIPRATQTPLSPSHAPSPPPSPPGPPGRGGRCPPEPILMRPLCWMKMVSLVRLPWMMGGSHECRKLGGHRGVPSTARTPGTPRGGAGSRGGLT